MIQFVYFDLGNILWSFDEDRACQNAADLFGVGTAEIRQAVYESGLQDRAEHGRVSTTGFCEQLVSSIAGTNQVSDLRAVADALSDMFTPIESMVSVIEAVRCSGARVGILSNTCEHHWDWIGRQQHPMMAGPFDAIVLSYEVNSMKPDDQIYRAAELAAGVPADQILFLDDKPENVLAAKMRGWQAEQCLGGSEANAVLKKRELL
ncbi:Alpha-D-glucose-1-phosphate phosphatase YihX [Rubripirellula obstinata]|uniref:Alpha-D-glucose-1-phosphate phosphatase YihX n=1 Tax=Rubripirellula obstinata TaxID=406547 RepID=A0A5B1CKY7_9BACT|nr:HAD family phosphatase [Rubripirellula obstinata]KAA1260200.1 Alpha-D-glucose-1-phosphate phosphatase YihX [Rubripirellula obstinata]